jgi:hypothetical protein
MLKSYLIYAMVFTSVIMIFPSCASSKKESKNIPVDFQLKFGSGGGFTGMWSGFMIQHDGKVQKWDGKMGSEKYQEFGILPNATLANILEEIKKNKIMLINHLKTGNITMSISLTLDSLENNILFTSESTDDTSKLLQSFYRNLDSTVNSIKK